MNWLRLRLPATSANLGPGFDALGLALGLSLSVQARARTGGACTVQASGRNADRVGSTEHNLLLETYRSLAPDGPSLHLEVQNQIPLGMGCGSSAAALVAGVMLADHFGGLGLSAQEVLEEACRREGHPDNVAACIFGGLAVSAMQQGQVTAVSVPCADLPWKIFLALPAEGLATSQARALLPESYCRADAVANVQATGLLVSAFTLGRADLLKAAMQDRIHQPYREEVCPLLPQLLPLAGVGGVHGIALSGAGPSVLLIADKGVERRSLEERVRAAVGDSVEIIETCISGGASVLAGDDEGTES